MADRPGRGDGRGAGRGDAVGPTGPGDSAGTGGGTSGTSGPDGPDAPSADAVRSALGRARAAARARGVLPGGAPGTGRSGVAARREARRRGPTLSGAGPDARDPQTARTSVDRLVGEMGWSAPVAVGGVVGRWAQVVGPEVAAHATPERFEDGVLLVRADSTAWAVQLRLLEPVIARRLDEELGSGVVTRLQVRGPGAPSWGRGPRRAAGGRGPRDTYG